MAKSPARHLVYTPASGRSAWSNAMDARRGARVDSGRRQGLVGDVGYNLGTGPEDLGTIAAEQCEARQKLEL